MKKGWLYRTSYDKKNHEIAPVLIQIEWWSRSSNDDPAVMIQIEWWSRSSPVMMIHIKRWSRSSDDVWWWSRSSDDVPWWSRLRDDPDPMMTWRWRWIEDEDELKMRWSSWYREEDQCWKLCRKNTFLVKRESWCICNFGMYSSMYFMYCNPMFILGCIYYVFESCFHALMFRSGESIMQTSHVKS